MIKMKYFVDDVEVTAEELEKIVDDWGAPAPGCGYQSWGFDVVVLDCIKDGCMYFYKKEFEC